MNLQFNLSEKLPYLDEKSVEDYTDLAIIGMDGTEVEINLLLLASWSTLLKKILRDIWNDEQNNKLVIVTNYSLTELKSLKNFITDGTLNCDISSAQFTKEFENVFLSFGIDLKYIFGLSAIPMMQNLQEFQFDDKKFPPIKIENEMAPATGVDPMEFNPLQVKLEEESDEDHTYIDDDENELFEKEKLYDVISRPDRSVACEICSKVVSCKKTLKSHVKKMHNGDPEVLSKIKNMVEEPIIARCKWTDCDIEMDQRKIGDHILAHQRKEKQYDIISRPDRSVACEVCSKIVSCKKNLKDHVKKIHPEYPELLVKIKNMVEEPIIARCEWMGCFKEMDQRKIDNHLKIHQTKELLLNPDTAADIKLFNCKKCHRVYQSQQVLNSHFKKTGHGTIEKRKKLKKNRKNSYICVTCGKSFNFLSSFNQHVEKCNQICSLCQMAVSKKGYKEHMKLYHKDVREHTCQYCGKAYIQRRYLLTHIRIVHKGKKDHVCFCGKAFDRPSNLKSHQSLVHEGKKDFICCHCGKAFGRDDYLRKHIKSFHEGQKSSQFDF